MKTFHELSVRGQAERLRRLAQEALAKYDLSVKRIRLITNDQNCIFRIDIDDGSKYILRVTTPTGGHTLDHVVAEMDWLEALARDTNIHVPRPLPARDGAFFVEASAEGVLEPRFCAIFSWVGGRNLSEALSPANATRLGELSARLHIHALKYTPPEELSLLRFDRVFPFAEPVVLFDERFDHLFNRGCRTTYRKAFDWAQESIDCLVHRAEPMRILHGDLHPWNVRTSHGILSPIDFEDLMLGWPAQDIGITLYYLLPRPDFSELRAAFQTGYTRQSPWPERRDGEIDSFIAARGIGLVNFVLNDPVIAARIAPAEFVERIEKRLELLLRVREYGNP